MRLRGFTPLIDEVVENHSLICAVVLGTIWRYTEMGNNEECYATQQTLADKCGQSISTIYRYTKELEEAGYIVNKSKRQNKKVYVVDKDRLALVMGVDVQPVRKKGSTHQPDRQRYNDNKSNKKSKRHVAVDAAEKHFYSVSKIGEFPEGTDKRKMAVMVWNPLGYIAKELEYDVDTIKECINKCITKHIRNGWSLSSPKSITNTSKDVIGEMRRDGLAPRR